MKIKSPNLNMIALLNTDMLYAKALMENIPFFDWYTWIEKTIQNEVFSQLRKYKQKGGKEDQGPKDPKSEKKEKAPESKEPRKSSKPNGNSPIKEGKPQVSKTSNAYSFSFNSSGGADAKPEAKKTTSSQANKTEESKKKSKSTAPNLFVN